MAKKKARPEGKTTPAIPRDRGAADAAARRAVQQALRNSGTARAPRAAIAPRGQRGR
jgi:hypothetical protein